MVASISARGNAASAARYYSHLQRDDYYSRDGEPPGRWAGKGAERLSLDGLVTQTEFDAALRGIDPKTGERLAQLGGREHAAGWDMTFSAPKSVSVLWALSEAPERQMIAQAHRSAVLAASTQLEATAGWARRGRAGATREQTAGLLMAQFDHHTSRESDPQLHTHTFVFNLAPRRDGSWGAIVSRELYKAQKQAGAAYRRTLASELERQGLRLERQKDTFRVAAIPRHIERAFSKRRQAIEEAAKAHGYSTPKGMELATLRTRRPKRDAKLSELTSHWQAEAKALGCDLGRSRDHMHVTTSGRSHAELSGGRGQGRSPVAQPSPPAALAAGQPTRHRSAAQLGSRLGQVLRALDQPAGMSGVRIKLRYREYERE
ncbi:putative ATP-dependent exoDNAse (exonuclease V) subunit alpha [Bradyrhizobium oligotrophicum S58]|uniref:Putative ATP-dependent exoDNAse (Exonuclease V) subunit alpha n=1 Tax=Bradyrhizobium oligotrophicum S58 TaxID=1245469 RepID=M4Z7H0_9BRAD|nr:MULTISPECIES: MobF family relaxase [Bradyrhizobium]BAM89484.1 putative ATP-dependent exoDNAse (exonuclease V) subunit alpha [Bradyrhizobium oligotrophicum S58]